MKAIALAFAVIVGLFSSAQAQVFSGPDNGSQISAGRAFDVTHGGLLYLPYISAYNIKLPISYSIWLTYPSPPATSTALMYGGAHPTNVFQGWYLFEQIVGNETKALQAFLDPATVATQGRCSVGILCARLGLVTDGHPHHVCTVWTPNEGYMIVDGALVDRQPNLSTGFVPTTAPWVIGSLSMPINDLMAEYAFWTKALSPADCAAISKRHHSGFSLFGGNSPLSISDPTLLAYIPMGGVGPCTGTNPTICPDLSPTAHNATTDPPPTLTFTSPAPNATIVGQTTIAANCVDSVTSCTQVQISVDGVIVNTDTASPYSFTFNSQLLNDGTHTIKVAGTNQGAITGSSQISVTSANGAVSPATYYMAATGCSDSNAGTLASPWCTPNHPVRCGDTILMAPGAYPRSALDQTFGFVWSCPSSTGVYQAIVKCSGTFVQDCSTTGTAQGASAVGINANNWAVGHMTASNPVPFAGCFGVYPGFTQIVIFDVYANNCGAGTGFGDGVAVIASLFYGSSNNDTFCPSALDMYAPTNPTTPDPNTRILILSNYIINNHNSPGCSDGEGIIIDNWYTNNYTQQIYVKNNMFLNNGSYGFEVNNNNTGPTYFDHNTTWGNGQAAMNPLSPGYKSGWVYEVSAAMSAADNNGVVTIFIPTCCVYITNNIIQSIWSGNDPNGNPVYAVSSWGISAPNGIDDNTIISPNGSCCWYHSNTDDGGSTMENSGNTHVDPGFTSPAAITTAPDCSAAVSVYACMNAVINTFTPTDAGSIGRGYQRPGACAADSKIPVWVKGVVPSGLATLPCGY